MAGGTVPARKRFWFFTGGAGGRQDEHEEVPGCSNRHRRGEVALSIMKYRRNIARNMLWQGKVMGFPVAVCGNRPFYWSE
jgi:hypothetical protein